MVALRANAVAGLNRALALGSVKVVQATHIAKTNDGVEASTHAMTGGTDSSLGTFFDLFKIRVDLQSSYCHC
jgi:hypothetical protein